MTPFDPHWALWNFIVDFGDLAALGPAVIAACAVLWARGRYRLALVWLVSFGICVGATFLAKAANGHSGFQRLDLGFAGAAPSGHTSISFAFYGVLAVLLYQALDGWRGAAAVSALVVTNLMVVAAITALNWHPWIDIALGAALGGACAGVAGAAFIRGSAGRADVAWAAAVAVLMLLFLHGTRLEADDAGISIRHEAWPDADRASRVYRLQHPEMPEPLSLEETGARKRIFRGR
jgi:membrane-associated phospholipid phosphatase